MSGQVISYDDMFFNYTHQILHSFEEVDKIDLFTGTSFDFEIKERKVKNRINPLIRAATLEDIDEIIFIYKDIYESSYPYKEMEDREEIRKMIESPNVEWIIFENTSGEIVGCFTFMLDFKNKMGNIRGFNLKKKFLGKLDIMKMAMGSIITMYKKYYDKIFRWYGECRTAHSKSQFFLSAAGFKPVAFYPCKDVFYGKVESDLLILSYDERALKKYRTILEPEFLPEIEKSFHYSDGRYDLGNYKISDPEIVLDKTKVKMLKKKIQTNISEDKFGYTDISLSIEGSDSYFTFLYTPRVQNFEKTKYKVNSLEELYVFLKEFKRWAKKFHVRYIEAFVSAYNVKHQKIFKNMGLTPRGYVPSWGFNKKSNSFEDRILFNYHIGAIDGDMKLLDEGAELLKYLDYEVNSELYS